MKNIWKIFLLDARRLSSNVVAMVIIMGLSIIPALYAWFNIMSNWDPYGSSATSQMNISVYSCDEGFSIGEASLNIGDKIVTNLEANSTIGWVFSDTEEEALEGVYSGDYYAAIIIPEDFTVKLLSFVGGDPENPQIEYWENSKKNAIATKITSKVKTTVQQSVNSSIISSITELATKAGDTLTDDEAVSLVDGIVSKLEDTNEDLDTYVNILDSLVLLTESGSDLIDLSQELLPSLEYSMDNGSEAIAGLQNTISSGQESAEAISALLNDSLDSVSRELDLLQSQLDALEIGMDYGDLADAYKEISQKGDSILAALNQYKGLSSDYDACLNEVAANYAALGSDIDQFASDAANTKAGLDALKTTTNAEIDKCQSSITALKSAIDLNISSKLEDTVEKIQTTLSQTQTMISNVSSDFPAVNTALENYAGVMEDGTESITAARDYVVTLQEALTRITDGIRGLSDDEEYSDVIGLLETDPVLIAEFVSSPISLQTEKIYEISSYGSAMAPFYTVLALWVGGLITVALVHTKVKPTKEMEGFHEVEKFFGRYIVFFLIGQAQTLITVLGDLFFLQIQCLHPFRFWLASAVMSFMFTFFMYALTVSLRNIGQAIAVIVMVIQVAGAGGTFPIEVLPAVYRAIYKFLPFTYAMNALRECVGGMYQWSYWQDLAVLGIYILVSIPIGLLLGKPVTKLLNKIDESKEKSGVMM